MKSVNRLLQALTVCGATLSGVFFFLSQTETESGLPPADQIQQMLQAEQNRSAALDRELKRIQGDNLKLDAELRNVRTESVSLAAQLSQLQRENARFVEERASRQAQAERLQNENARLARELAETQANSVPKEQLAAYEAKVEQLERVNLELRQTAPQPVGDKPLASLVAPANPTLRGNVLAVGKGASFVVLDIGFSDGVRLQHELFIQRADSPIAKIQVTEVKENLSIARVLPDSLLRAPQTGDAVSSFN